MTTNRDTALATCITNNVLAIGVLYLKKGIMCIIDSIRWYLLLQTRYITENFMAMKRRDGVGG